MSAAARSTILHFKYVRTVDHLRAWSKKLPPAVKEVIVKFQYKRKEHIGTERYLCQHIPQLKYHNPLVTFTTRIQRDREPVTDCFVKFVLDDGGEYVVETNMLNTRDIKDKIESQRSLSSSASSEGGPNIWRFMRNFKENLREEFRQRPP